MMTRNTAQIHISSIIVLSCLFVAHPVTSVAPSEHTVQLFFSKPPNVFNTELSDVFGGLMCQIRMWRVTLATIPHPTTTMNRRRVKQTLRTFSFDGMFDVESSKGLFLFFFLFCCSELKYKLVRNDMDVNEDERSSNNTLMLWVRISTRARCTAFCDTVCQWLATGRWFSPGPPVSYTNKTDRHHATEILLKVALNTTKQKNIEGGIW